MMSVSIRRRERPRDRGYTLVELVIVMLVMSILASIGVPMLATTHGSMKLDAGAREVVAALRYAQAVAVSSGTPHGVEFDTNAESFRCYQRSDATSTVTIENPLTHKPYVVDFASEGIDIGTAQFGSESVCEFATLGSPESGGQVGLIYASSSRTVRVQNILGYVTTVD